jgi:trehalose/maltose hydrolase-like predicted phosphorylase
MKKAMFGLDPWLVTQEGWDAGLHEAAESMFSLGNGFFGQRAMHEEAYSGHTLEGYGLFWSYPSRLLRGRGLLSGQNPGRVVEKRLP